MNQGLTFEEYKAQGVSGEYRPDLDRYFLPGMEQPPLPVRAADEPVLQRKAGKAVARPIKPGTESGTDTATEEVKTDVITK